MTDRFWLPVLVNLMLLAILGSGAHARIAAIGDVKDEATATTTPCSWEEDAIDTEESPFWKFDAVPVKSCSDDPFTGYVVASPMDAEGTLNYIAGGGGADGKGVIVCHVTNAICAIASAMADFEEIVNAPDVYNYLTSGGGNSNIALGGIAIVTTSLGGDSCAFGGNEGCLLIWSDVNNGSGCDAQFATSHSMLLIDGPGGTPLVSVVAAVTDDDC